MERRTFLAWIVGLFAAETTLRTGRTRDGPEKWMTLWGNFGPDVWSR